MIKILYKIISKLLIIISKYKYKYKKNLYYRKIDFILF